MRKHDYFMCWHLCASASESHAVMSDTSLPVAACTTSVSTKAMIPDKAGFSCRCTYKASLWWRKRDRPGVGAISHREPKRIRGNSCAAARDQFGSQPRRVATYHTLVRASAARGAARCQCRHGCDSREKKSRNEAERKWTRGGKQSQSSKYSLLDRPEMQDFG